VVIAIFFFFEVVAFDKSLLVELTQNKSIHDRGIEPLNFGSPKYLNKAKNDDYILST